MQTENQKKLNALLDKFDEKQTEIKKEIDKKQQEKNEFLGKFKKFCSSVIKPTMEEIGESLKSKGHDYNINYSQETKSEKGASVDPRITMEILPNKKGKSTNSNKAAHVMFFADTHKNEIGIHENTMVYGGSGSAGAKHSKYNLETLTKEKIEEEVVDSLDKIFNNRY